MNCQLKKSTKAGRAKYKEPYLQKVVQPAPVSNLQFTLNSVLLLKSKFTFIFADSIKMRVGCFQKLISAPTFIFLFKTNSARPGVYGNGGFHLEKSNLLADLQDSAF